MVEIATSELLILIGAVCTALTTAIAFLIRWVKSNLEKAEDLAEKEVAELRDKIAQWEGRYDAQNKALLETTQKCAKLEATVEKMQELHDLTSTLKDAIVSAVREVVSQSPECVYAKLRKGEDLNG